ncbi:hypothetical protein BDD12DRAFT_871917 [Trichophaea hybrida]|nr:hypothetical protein BDD12DRAFT_871917 [Trichophaea hybrida]
MSDQPMKRDRSSPFSHESSFGDIDSFLDFGDNSFFTSPAVNTSTLQRPSFSTSSPSSAQSTPSTTSEFPAPSHPYGLHLQQTDVLGLDIGEKFFGENQAFMQLDNDSSTLTHSSNSSLPPYFYPERPATTTAETMSQGISPLMTIGELGSAPVKMETSPAPTVIRPQPQRMNYYPGYHQEMYNENVRALQAQKLARQKAAAAAPPRATPHPQQDKIDALLDSFRSTGSPATLNKSQNDLLPHIARMKKEEDEMDEDERLLASEEGKKLSSKERRQLRNKVSARAFRSRRKEYISQLEAEVAKKTQEAEVAKDSARRLEEENARLRGFSEMLMKHAAFQEFLKDITAPLTNPQSIAQSQPRTVAPTAVEPIPTPTFNPFRDHNPNTTTEEQWPLAYNNWNNTSHVYSVEVPDFPAIQDLDGKMTFEEDYTIADGFFSRIRDEKASIQFDHMDEEEEETYQPPENIEDLYVEVESEKERNLDELFPGVGVNSLLERLELIAGGSARPEDLFDIQQEEVPAVTESSPRIESETCRVSNRMLEAAEGVYRRIGLAVGGQ